jgi:outer membrane protein TolC
MKKMNRIVCALLGGFACLSPVFAAEDVKTEKTEPAVTAVVATELTATEKEILELLRGAFGKNDAKGEFLKNRKAVEITRREAAVQGLEKNLSIQRQRKSEAIAREAVMEAKALFLPTFSANLYYNESEAFERSAKVKVWKSGTTTRDLGGGNVEYVLVLSPEAQQQSTIKELVFRDPRMAGYQMREIKASEETDKTESWIYYFNVAQQLPWGSSLNVGITTKEKHTFFDNEGGDYKRPWSTSVATVLDAPLPLTKGFGRYAAAEVSLRLSRLQKDRAFWDVKTVINGTLLDVDMGYWNLVASARVLLATVKNRQTLETILGNTEKLLAAGRATAYGKKQVQAELAGVKDIEARAWNNYLRASTALALLLNQDKDAVMLPVGYGGSLDEAAEMALADAMSVALQNRPELKAEETGELATEIILRQSENGTRPDLRFNFNFTIEQNGSVFGYKTLADSINFTDFNKDTQYQTYALNYSYPWRNLAARALKAASQASHERQRIAVSAVKNQITEEVNNAVVYLLSAQAQVEIASQNLKLAEEAFDNACKLRDAGKMSEFQIIGKSAATLSANYNLIAALVERKKAESRLLAAEGVLPHRFADKTAASEFDRQRIRKVSHAHPLPFFAPIAMNRQAVPAQDKTVEAVPLPTASAMSPSAVAQ